MSEQLSFGEYQDFVVGSRFREIPGATWHDQYSEYLDGELIEMVGQHGNGMLLLLPFQNEISSLLPDKAEKTLLQHGMADEMGDILWFSFDVASRHGTTISDACSAALTAFKVEHETPLASFSDIEQYAINHADKIRVMNKTGIYGFELADHVIHTTLEQNAQYLLMRTGRRLSRSLDQGAKDAAPFTASELEGIVETKQALGEYLLVLSYVAKEKLEVGLEDIAQFNMAKLAHRKLYGKTNDIKFTDWIAKANEFTEEL